MPDFVQSDVISPVHKRKGTPPSGVRLDIDESHERAYLNVSGDVDVSTAEQLRKRLMILAKSSAKHIILRLKNVQYMDSAGVAVILELVQEARKTKTELLLLEPSPAAKRALGMIEIEALVNLYESMEECAECLNESAQEIRCHFTDEKVAGASGRSSASENT